MLARWRQASMGLLCLTACFGDPILSRYFSCEVTGTVVNAADGGPVLAPDFFLLVRGTPDSPGCVDSIYAKGTVLYPDGRETSGNRFRIRGFKWDSDVPLPSRWYLFLILSSCPYYSHGVTLVMQPIPFECGATCTLTETRETIPCHDFGEIRLEVR